MTDSDRIAVDQQVVRQVGGSPEIDAVGRPGMRTGAISPRVFTAAGSINVSLKGLRSSRGVSFAILVSIVNSTLLEVVSRRGRSGSDRDRLLQSSRSQA